MALQYTNPPLMPNGQGMFNRPPTVPLATPPPYTAPIAGSVLGSIAGSAVSLLLPVAAFFGTFFSFVGAAGDVNESKAVQNFNTGERIVTRQAPYIPPFEGGQMENEAYDVSYLHTVTVNPAVYYNFEWRTSITFTGTIRVLGKINGIFNTRPDSQSYGVFINAKSLQTGQYQNIGVGGVSNFGNITDVAQFITSIRRLDGQDTGGNLPNTNPVVTSASPTGYTGTNGETLQDKQKKVLPPNPDALKANDRKPLGTVPNTPPALSGAKNKTPKDLLPSPKNPAPSSVAAKSPSGFQSTPATQISASQTYANGMTNELYNSRRLLQPPTPSTPNSPSTPPTPDITGQLAGLGAILGTISANTTDIKNNTSPEALKNAAKTGSCEMMQSPDCTQGVENRIKNPLNQNIDSAKAALAANQLGQDAAFASILDSLTKIKTFLDNTITDRAIGVANFAMNVHNALMLSNNLGKTLATVVDSAMNLTPFRFTDATTGQNTTASRAFSQNVSALIINLIGEDRYIELADDWKIANRIYQSTTNSLNKVERLLGNQSKVAQKGNVDVANIGNALVANGVVNANSYPPMVASKEANTPPDVFIDSQTPLSGISSTLKNLNEITRNVNSNLRQVTALQKDFGKIADLVNKESKVRKSSRRQTERQVKKRAKFTSLTVKQIKSSGQKKNA